MTKEHYNELIEVIKNDKDFYIGQVGDLLIVKNSKGKKRVLSGHKDDGQFGYWLVIDHPDYDLKTGKVKGRLGLYDKPKCETLIDVKRAADDLSIS